MAELVIIRGLPGSGKSTIARTEYEYHKHVEADMWHMTPNGYDFKVDQMGVAHKWCELTVERWLRNGVNVVVSNTHINWEQTRPYLAIAKRCGAEVQVIEADGNFENIHDVPAEIIEKMIDNYEDIGSKRIDGYMNSSRVDLT